MKFSDTFKFEAQKPVYEIEYKRKSTEYDNVLKEFEVRIQNKEFQSEFDLELFGTLIAYLKKKDAETFESFNSKLFDIFKPYLKEKDQTYDKLLPLIKHILLILMYINLTIELELSDYEKLKNSNLSSLFNHMATFYIHFLKLFYAIKTVLPNQCIVLLASNKVSIDIKLAMDYFSEFQRFLCNLGYIELRNHNWDGASIYFNEHSRIINEEIPNEYKTHELPKYAQMHFYICHAICAVKTQKFELAGNLFTTILQKMEAENIFYTSIISDFLPDYIDYLMSQNAHHQVNKILNTIYNVYDCLKKQYINKTDIIRILDNDMNAISKYRKYISSNYWQILENIVQSKFPNSRKVSKQQSNSTQKNTFENKLEITLPIADCSTNIYKKLSSLRTQGIIIQNKELGTIHIDKFNAKSPLELTQLLEAIETILLSNPKTESMLNTTPSAKNTVPTHLQNSGTPLHTLTSLINNLQITPTKQAQSKKETKPKNTTNSVSSIEKENTDPNIKNLKQQGYTITSFRSRSNTSETQFEYYAACKNDLLESDSLFKNICKDPKIVGKKAEGFKFYNHELVGKILGSKNRLFPSRIERTQKGDIVFVYDENIKDKKEIKRKGINTK